MTGPWLPLFIDFLLLRLPVHLLHRAENMLKVFWMTITLVTVRGHKAAQLQGHGCSTAAQNSRAADAICACSSSRHHNLFLVPHSSFSFDERLKLPLSR
eukprot:s2788_g7.t1